MTCVVTDLFLPLCLTLTYNVSTATLISSSVDCGECQFEAEFDFETKNQYKRKREGFRSRIILKIITFVKRII